MYAVFRTGGKQYRATTGDRLRVERLDAEEGSTVEFDQVLLVGEGADVQLGSPVLAGGRVEAKVTSQGRGKKIVVDRRLRLAAAGRSVSIDVSGEGLRQPALAQADFRSPPACPFRRLPRR